MASAAAQELSSTLDVIAEGQAGWVHVHRCRVCGQKWAEDCPLSERHGGGPRCFYAIVTDDPNGWLREGSVLTHRLREEAEDRAFYEVLGEERATARCQADGCIRGAIEHSVFCRVHHLQMVKRKPCPYRE